MLPSDTVHAALAGDAEARASCDAVFTARALVDRMPQSFGLDPSEAADALLDSFLRQYVRSGCSSQIDVATMSATAEDVVLAAAYRRGTSAAIDEFRARFTGIIRYITRQCLAGADALEAEDESWAALWEKLGQYEGRSNLGTWLYVVVRRWCWNRSRQKPPPGPEWTSDEGMGVEERLAAPDPEIAVQVACDQFATALDRCTVLALRALSPQERALLRLRYVHRLPLETLRLRPEIYAAGEPAQPVYGITRRVQRAGRRLRETVVAALSEQGFDPAECARLLQECEHVQAGMARRLLEELASGSELQIDGGGVSNKAEATPHTESSLRCLEESELSGAQGDGP